VSVEYLLLLFLVAAFQVRKLLLEQVYLRLLPDLEGLELAADRLELLRVVVALPVQLLVDQHFVFQLHVELADLAAQVFHYRRLVRSVGFAAE
jgi:hypothetical protein